MTTRFYEKGEGEDKTYWYEHDELDMELTEANLFANLHEVMDDESCLHQSDDGLFDRVAVLDPRDDCWFQHWRYDLGDEMFGKLEYVVRKTGSYLCRQTALDQTKELFYATHQFTDTDFTQLLESS